MSGRKNFGRRKYWNKYDGDNRQQKYSDKYRRYGSYTKPILSLPEQKKVTKAWHEFELWKLKREFKKKENEKKTLEEQTEKDETPPQQSESTMQDHGQTLPDRPRPFKNINRRPKKIENDYTAEDYGSELSDLTDASDDEPQQNW